jgi:hypothetical protein
MLQKDLELFKMKQLDIDICLLPDVHIQHQMPERK